MLRVWLLVLGLVVSGCAARQLGHGAPSWHLVATEHFKVYSDLPVARARARAEDFERWLSAYQQHGWTVSGPLPLQLNVVLFRDSFDFRAHGGRDLAGYHLASVLFEPWIVMPDGRDAQALVTFRHELTHYIAHLGMYRQPAWFAEGIACYFETAHFNERGAFVVGSLPPWRALWLTQHGIMSVEEVFAPDTEVSSHGFYASSWLIVHYLISEHPEEFEAYQLALARGMGHEAAWASAFARLPPAELDKQVRAYWKADAFAKWARTVSAPPGHAEVRALSTADEHALEAILSVASCDECTSEERVRRIETAFRTALEVDATQPQAASWLLMNGSLSKEQATRRAAELTRAHPDDWLAWTARGVVALRTGQLGELATDDDPVLALRRVAPDHPYTHLLAAFQHAQRGERDAAIRESRSAQRISKANPHLLWMEAELLAGLSACTELHDTVNTLLGLGHNEAPDAAQRAELAKLEARCTQD